MKHKSLQQARLVESAVGRAGSVDGDRREESALEVPKGSM